MSDGTLRLNTHGYKAPYGHFNPNLPGSFLGPYLTVPSDTTATYLNGNERYIVFVGPLNSIQYVIARLEYIPPAEAEMDFYMWMFLSDKNGLKAAGLINMTVSTPDPLP